MIPSSSSSNYSDLPQDLRSRLESGTIEQFLYEIAKIAANLQAMNGGGAKMYRIQVSAARLQGYVNIRARMPATITKQLLGDEVNITPFLLPEETPEGNIE